MPVKPIAWWDFEDDIESDGYTEDKIGNVRVVLREKSGAEDSRRLGGKCVVVQSRFVRSRRCFQRRLPNSSEHFQIFPIKLKNISSSRQQCKGRERQRVGLLGAPQHTTIVIQGQGNEIIRVGLKYANDDDENPLGRLCSNERSLSSFEEGLHWHLDNYRKVPIMNTSKGFPDQYNYLPVQRWAHLVITWDNEANTEEEKGVGRVYIDGNMVGEVSTSKQEMFLTNQNVEIGTAWGGAIDELMVFDRALTQCQIDKIYSAGHAGLYAQ